MQELNRYRSDFFGRLREILSDRENIRIVGDRFVFQSEVLFPSGGSELNPDGQTEMAKLATALLDLAKEIPPEINWVLRVDGHTDNVPLSGFGRYADNWELSSARAISVVKFLISRGVPADRLVAAGFGEFQPLGARRQRAGPRDQPAHRAEADGEVTAAACCRRRAARPGCFPHLPLHRCMLGGGFRTGSPLEVRCGFGQPSDRPVLRLLELSAKSVLGLDRGRGRRFRRWRGGWLQRARRNPLRWLHLVGRYCQAQRLRPANVMGVLLRRRRQLVSAIVELQAGEPGVEAALADERLVRAFLDDAAVVHDEDPVGLQHGR